MHEAQRLSIGSCGAHRQPHQLPLHSLHGRQDPIRLRQQSFPSIGMQPLRSRHLWRPRHHDPHPHAWSFVHPAIAGMHLQQFGGYQLHERTRRRIPGSQGNNNDNNDNRNSISHTVHSSFTFTNTNTNQQQIPHSLTPLLFFFFPSVLSCLSGGDGGRNGQGSRDDTCGCEQSLRTTASTNLPTRLHRKLKQQQAVRIECDDTLIS